MSHKINAVYKAFFWLETQAKDTVPVSEVIGTGLGLSKGQRAVSWRNVDSYKCM